MWVSPNQTDWFDGLAFIVSYGEGERPLYTVNEEGLVYPDNYSMFRDDAGYYQQEMFGPRWPNRLDIVGKDYDK